MTVVVHVLCASAWHCLPEATSVVVHEANETDSVAIQGVVAACRGVAGFGHGLSTAGLASTARRHVRTWLARDSDGSVIGAAGLARLDASGCCRWSIPYLLVIPSARRRGVATGLVRVVLQAAADDAARHVTIETSTAWVDASAFWGSLSRTLEAAGGQSPGEPACGK